jgi:O-antigen ligase
VHLALALLATALFASSAVHEAEPFTDEYLVRWLPFLAVTVILIDVVSREVPIRAVLVAAVGGAVVAGAGALISLVVVGEARANGPLDDPNDLAYVLVAAVPLLVAAIPLRRGWLHGALPYAAGAILIVGAIATFSRGGGLALLAATAWLVARRVLAWRVVVAAVVFLAGLALAAVLFAGPGLAKAVQEKAFIASSNVDTRELRWQSAARMLTGNPAFGVGPGGFRSEYAAASHNAEIDEQTPVAHNMYLEVGAELGVPGLVFFLGVIATSLVASERALRQGTDRGLMVALQASTAAVLVASTFLSEQYYLPLWLPIALGAAADLRSRQQQFFPPTAKTAE